MTCNNKPFAMFFNASPRKGWNTAKMLEAAMAGAEEAGAETVKEGRTIRGSNQVERRLGTGVTVHHTEDDVVNWLNEVFK